MTNQTSSIFTISLKGTAVRYRQHERVRQQQKPSKMAPLIQDKGNTVVYCYAAVERILIFHQNEPYSGRTFLDPLNNTTSSFVRNQGLSVTFKEIEVKLTLDGCG